MSSRMTLSLLTTRLVVALPSVAPADAEEHVAERRRVGRRRSCGRSCVPTSQQHRRVHRAGIDHQPGELHARHVGDRHRHVAVVGHQRREAETEHHGVGPLDLERPVQVVDAGGEDQVLAAGERVVDRLCVVGRPGDEELRRSGSTSRPSARRPTSCPTELRPRPRARRRCSAARVHVQERRLSRHRAGRQRRVRATARRLRGEALGRRTHDAGEHLVPDAVGPVAEHAVPGEPLLLRAVDDDAAAERRVGDEAAAGERRPGAVVHQRDVAAGDVDPAHRRGLRHRPELAAVAAEARGGHVDGQVRQASARSCSSAMQLPPRALVADVDGPVDDHVGRRQPEPGHGGVVADLEVEGGGSRAVGAGLEQQGVTLRAHLVVDLLGGDGVNGCLDLARRHAGVEDLHVRAEVRRDRRRFRGLGAGGHRRDDGGDGGCEDQEAPASAAPVGRRPQGIGESTVRLHESPPLSR